MSEDEFKIKIESASGPAPETPFPVPARWRIEVRSFSGPDVDFKGAIARDGRLELIESSTPLDRAFTASRIIGLFEAAEGCKLQVTSFIEVDGQFQKQAMFGGDRAGKFIFEPSLQAYGAGSL